MKKVFFKTLFFAFIMVLQSTTYNMSAQNCNVECTELLQNPNLEIDPTFYPLPNGAGLSFYDGYIPGWKNSHGTAHTFQLNNSGVWDPVFTYPNGTEKSGMYAHRVAWSKIWGEGFFQDILLSNDPYITYHLFIRYQVKEQIENFPPNHFISFKIASNLVNGRIYSGTPPQNIPQRVLHTQHMNNYDVIETCLEFQLNENEMFDQIWVEAFPPEEIVPSNGQWTAFDNISLLCNTEALTQINTTHNWLNVEFSSVNASSMSQFVEYYWDFGDGNFSTQAEPVHTYGASGTYNVCLKVKDNNGCCGELCQQITVDNPPYSCDNLTDCIGIGLPNATVYLSSLIEGSNPVIPSVIGPFGYRLIQNACFTLEGKLVIDRNVILLNTHWFNDSGAEIEVYGRLWSANSQFQACSLMWRGFVLPESNQSDNRAYFTNSLIRDAYIGIEAFDNTSVVARNSEFLNNIVGISLKDQPNAFEIINNFTDNEFYFSGNMLGKYPGQPNYKPRSESGISVYNLAMLNVDGNNVFRNLEYGIKAKKSGMSINNKNSFIIDDITSAMNRYTNYGIYMEESNSNVVINDNDFNGNTCSVMCYNGMNNLLDIVENRFVMHSDIEMYIGPRIVVRNNKGGNFSVEKKNIFDVNISSFSFAISFSDNSHHKIHIDDNIFNFKFNSAGTSHVIDFQRNYFDQNYSEDLTSPLVSNNRFNMDRSNSITIYNSPGMVLVNNNFYTNTANPGYGHLIDILNSDDGFFRDNTAHDMTDLFRASSSVNNTFCCNTSNIFGRTFLFTNGGEQFSSLYANKIKTLELKHGSTIGVQPSRGNIWNPQQSSAQITEFEANQTYISKNQFIVDPVQIGHKPLDIYPSLWGSQWFRTTGTSKSCEEYQECNIDNPGGNGGGDADISDDKVNEVAVNYVRTCKHNATGLNPYKELSEWENAMYMYKFQYKYPLIDWESKIDSVQLLEGVNECNGEILQEVIDWYLIQEDIRNIYEMTDSAIIEINNAHQVIRENALEITDWHINNPDPSVVIQPVLYYQNITSAVSRIEGINANLKLSSQARAVNILGRLANLSSRYPFLTELKKVREIEMRIIINGAKNISENEWKDLLRIAKLCPLDYGSVVYEAWGILDSHGLGTDEISIENNCARTIKPRSMQTDITNLNIFPNPSNGNVVIGWGNQEADQILVYDFTGKEIMRSKLVNISEKINLDFSDNNNGLYYVKLMNKNELVASGRLVLIR